jgi:DNA-binding beta-propeller fold protein YncE
VGEVAGAAGDDRGLVADGGRDHDRVDDVGGARGGAGYTIGVGDGPSAIAAAKGAVWVGDEFGATPDRIDPQARRVVRAVPVGSSPRGIVVAGSGAWVAARPFAAAGHRGGTLTVVSDPLPGLDPAQQANDPYPLGISALATVYGGLVAFRRGGGAQGFTAVPDLVGCPLTRSYGGFGA